MGTFVLLAAFLLVASATPIQHLSDTSDGDTLDTQSEDGPSSLSEDVSVSNAEPHPSDTPTDATSGNGGQDEASSSTYSEDGSESGSTHPEDDSEHSGGGDAPQNEDNSNLHSETSSVPSEDNTADDAGGAVTSSVSTVSSIATESSSATAPTDKTGDMLSTLVSIDSTNSTISPSDETTESQNITEPPDADPADCRTRHPETHHYLFCQFSCGGDMMLQAPENATCLVNYTEEAGNLSAQHGSNRSNTLFAEGVCTSGQCVERISENVPATEDSPNPELNDTSSVVGEQQNLPTELEADVSKDVTTPEPQALPVRD